LILISAAILINANTALAADRVGDAHVQARELLSGTVGRTGSIDKSIAIAAHHHQTAYPDPQEQARQFIFGKPSFDGNVSRESAVQSKSAPAPLSARRNSRVHADPQELARRTILGTGGSGGERAGMRLSGIREAKR
jgi:hypothetical protein